MEATPANMRLCELRGYARIVAVDPATGETFSATSGDYFWQPDDEPLTNNDGEPLILAHHVPETWQPVTP